MRVIIVNYCHLHYYEHFVIIINCIVIISKSVTIYMCGIVPKRQAIRHRVLAVVTTAAICTAIDEEYSVQRDTL